MKVIQGVKLQIDVTSCCHRCDVIHQSFDVNHASVKVLNFLLHLQLWKQKITNT